MFRPRSAGRGANVPSCRKIVALSLRFSECHRLDQPAVLEGPPSQRSKECSRSPVAAHPRAAQKNNISSVSGLAVPAAGAVAGAEAGGRGGRSGRPGRCPPLTVDAGCVIVARCVTVVVAGRRGRRRSRRHLGVRVGPLRRLPLRSAAAAAAAAARQSVVAGGGGASTAAGALLTELHRQHLLDTGRGAALRSRSGRRPGCGRLAASLPRSPSSPSQRRQLSQLHRQLLFNCRRVRPGRRRCLLLVNRAQQMRRQRRALPAPAHHRAG